MATKPELTRGLAGTGLKHRLWLFDFDNTLAALEKQVDWAASRRELESFLRAEGIDQALFQEFPLRNLPLYNALVTRLPANSGHVQALIRRASAIIEAYELRGVDNAIPLPGTKELLLSLISRDKRIAIVTSNSSRTVTRWLARHYLVDHGVTTIVGRDSLLPLKPAPEMVNRAIELSCGSAEETVLVGDSQADLEAARRAHIAFFGIAGNLEARTHLEGLGTREIFSSPGDLARRVFGLLPEFEERN